MARRRKKPRVPQRPELTVAQILAWADLYYSRMGRWPKKNSGRIPGALGETWMAVDGALYQGLRGLPKEGSLPKLLAEHRGVRNLADLPRLSVNLILGWADAHYRRSGTWPTKNSGAMAEAPGETWNAVDKALQKGSRGIRRRTTLADLLARRRYRPHKGELPPLSEEQILTWAEAYHTLFGLYPTSTTGLIGNTGETWSVVDKALRFGYRGLPGGESLFRLLKRHGKLAGAKTFYRRPGNHPLKNLRRPKESE